jgi:Ca2+-binding EF-hand superfamily protein
MSHLSDSTNKLLENKKINSFKRIFKLLDSDEDNQINKLSIDMKRLPNKVTEIINPIINSIRIFNESKTEDDFLKDIEELYHVFYIQFTIRCLAIMIRNI